MTCPECDGKGRMHYKPHEWTREGEGFDMIMPCPTCGGCGVVHCCEGEVAQPGEGDDVQPST